MPRVHNRDPVAGRTARSVRIGVRSGAAAVMLSLAVAGAGCDSARGTTKAGATPKEPEILHLAIAGKGTLGAGGAFTGIFHGPKPFSPGDSWIIWNTLSPPSLEIVYCLEPPTTLQGVWCTHSYVLPSGQLIAEGEEFSTRGGATDTIPVVGGTGAYAGAHGTDTIYNGSENPYVVIRLQ
jgi:hypothetical protein